MKQQVVFLDTNVLKHIACGSEHGKYIASLLEKNEFKVVTFRKCVYEIYSIIRSVAIKSVNRSGISKEDPVDSFVSPKIKEVSKVLYENHHLEQGNIEYWLNLSQEWQGWDYLSRNLERVVQGKFNKEVGDTLELQKDYLKWKSVINECYVNVDNSIKEHGIVIYDYSDVYGSDWYKNIGYSIERDAAMNSMFPNEDFEIIIAALFSDTKVFITDEKKKNGIVLRGGNSISLSIPICFCNSNRLREAIDEGFLLRAYSE